MPKKSDAAMDARRATILHAAIACFAEQGVDGTSMRDICDRAGVSRGGLYVHFDNKDALVEAVFAFLNVQSQQVFEAAAPADRERSPVLAVLEQGFEMFRQPGLRTILSLDAELKAQCLRKPELLPGRRQEAIRMVDAMTDLVRVEQQRGVFPASLDPFMVACVLFAVHDGTKQTMTLADESFDFDAYKRTVMALLGLGD